MRYKQIATVGTVLITTLILLAALLYYFNQGNYCPRGTFSCGSGSKCITQGHICNGFKDCPDGSDEADCFDGLEDSWSFSDNFAKCSNKYRVENKDHKCNYSKCLLICKDFQDSRIPDIFLNKEVLTIRFDKSSLPILTRNFFQDFPNISNIINLNNSKIRSIEPQAFANQNKVLWLCMSHNLIEELSEGHFVGLHSLDTLLLDNNKMHTMNMRDLENSTSLQVLDLSNNRLNVKNLLIPYLPALRDLVLDQNHLESITDDLFAGLPMLRDLNLEYNQIQNISGVAFQNLNELQMLSLNILFSCLHPNIELTHHFAQIGKVCGLKCLKNVSNLKYNRITTIASGLFEPVGCLSMLWIGYNPLQSLEESVFSPLKKKLKSFNIEGIDIQEGKQDFFNNFERLKHVYFKKFHYCTSYGLKANICHPANDGVSSLEHLLSSSLLRSAVWGISCVTCLGNALVLWGRFTAKDENRVLSIVIRNLAVSDIFMGIYLFIIGLEDIRFRNNYNQEAGMWISSWSCTFVGMLAMISSEVSVLILSFMSVERFMLIAAPLKGYRAVTPRAAASSMIVIWIVGVILAVIPAIHWQSSTRFYGLNGMCFPLHIDDPYIVGWEYSTFIFLGVNLVGLVTIVYVYVGMFISIWRTRHATPLSVGDFEFALRFFFIVLTGIVCWAPIIVLKIMALAQYPVAPELHGWVVVFILPVNSAVNPLLYTFTTPKFRERLSEGWFGKIRYMTSGTQSRSDSQISNSYNNKNMTAMPSHPKPSNEDKFSSLQETILINIITKED